MTGYAAVLGEALVDLLDGECGGRRVYRQAIGGGPLNVAVGVARLGGAVEFVGSVGQDVLADRIRAFLAESGVGRRGVVTVAAPTTLAVATFAGAEPDFRFYGDPPSYALLDAATVNRPLVEDATVLYCGSIALLCPPALGAARLAWSATRGQRVFDPNVRARLLPDRAAVAALREVVAEFAVRADLLKLSGEDAAVLYPGESGARVVERLAGLGATAVVLTMGERGALVCAGAGPVLVPAPKVDAVDATGAGDAVMAALIAELLDRGPVNDPAEWARRVRFALRVAGLVCESPGGAVAMPTRERVAARFPD